MLFSLRILASEGMLSVSLGASWHLPNIRTVSRHPHDSIRVSKAWCNPEKFRSNVAFLLILTEGCTLGDRVYSLSTMWVHPYQARVSTMEKVVKQLTSLTCTGPDWPYTVVQLNRDAHLVPLPMEGHLSIMVEGGTSSITCGRITQLEVCQLLSLGSQVIYLAGLNGCQVPMIMSLPELLARGATLLGGKPAPLPVDTLQSTTKGQEPKVLPFGGHSPTIPTASPIRAHPPKVEGQVSMTIKVRELLSWAALDTSGHASGSSTPKRLEPMVLVIPLPHKWEDLTRLVDTSSQVSAPDDAEMEDPSLEEIPTTSSPVAGTPGPSSNGPPLDIAHLQEEANKAFGDLLATKSLIDAHQQKLFSNFSMTFQQNESKTLESIKGAKAQCPLFTSHPRDRESGSHSGLLHSAITHQRHSASQRRVPWGGEKRSTQFPQHLSGCPEH